MRRHGLLAFFDHFEKNLDNSGKEILKKAHRSAMIFRKIILADYYLIAENEVSFLWKRKRRERRGIFTCIIFMHMDTFFLFFVVKMVRKWALSYEHFHMTSLGVKLRLMFKTGAKEYQELLIV